MKVGLTSVTFRALEAEQIITLAKNAGADGIEWGGDIHVPCGNFDVARRVAAATKDAGLAVFSYGSYYRLGEGTPFGETLETAMALGTKCIRVWAGNAGSANTNADTYQKILADLRAAAALALPKGITVACEFHNNTWNDTAESALTLLTDAELPNIKTYWQPTRFDAEDGAILKKIRHHVCMFHVFMWNAAGKRYPLKKGAEAWRGYLAETDCPAILEFVKRDSIRAFQRDMQTLKTLIR